MSDNEFWTGSVRIIRPNAGEDLEAQCKRLCEEKNVEKESYHDSYAATVKDELSRDFAIANGSLYDVSQMKDNDNDDICEASRIDEDTISVTLKFYNGGTNFQEMFEEAISKLNGSEKSDA